MEANREECVKHEHKLADDRMTEKHMQGQTHWQMDGQADRRTDMVKEQVYSNRKWSSQRV